MKNKILIFGLFFLFCIPICLEIFHPGFFVSDDGNWMVIRLSSFYEALSSGQFPVRMLPRLNQGIGYPVADFLYPLFLYIGSVIHLFKIPFLLDIKLLFALSLIGSGIGMYLFLRKSFGTTASFIGSIIYLYLPYHLYDLYARGSMGEVVALAIIPFLLWAIERKAIVVSSIFLGFLITSHNTLALFFLPFVIVYAYLTKMKVQQMLLLTSLGLGLAAFFWIPALIDKQFTVFDSVAVSNPFSYFVNTISYGLIGWIGVAIFGGVLFTRFSLKNTKVLFFIISGIIGLFFSFSLSSGLWHIKPLVEFIQFPFRFLSIVLLSESFLAAYIIEKMPQKILTSIFLLLLLLFSSWAYLFPKAYSNNPESFYTTNTATTTVQNEYMPIWVKRLPASYTYQKVITANGEAENMVLKGTKLQFSINLQVKTTILITFVYFPGWKATIDGQPATLSPSWPYGLLQLEVPKGTHVVAVWFGETPLRLFADGISIVALLICLFLGIKKIYEK